MLLGSELLELEPLSWAVAVSMAVAMLHIHLLQSKATLTTWHLQSRSSLVITLGCILRCTGTRSTVAQDGLQGREMINVVASLGGGTKMAPTGHAGRVGHVNGT